MYADADSCQHCSDFQTVSHLYKCGVVNATKADVAVVNATKADVAAVNTTKADVAAVNATKADVAALNPIGKRMVEHWTGTISQQ